MVRSIKRPLRELKKRWTSARSRWVLRVQGLRGSDIGSQVVVRGRLIGNLAQESRVVIADRVVLNSSPRANTLEARGPTIINAVREGALITIGEDSGLTSATLSAALEVKVGRRVLVGAGCLITDSDHHVVASHAGARRYLGLPTPRSRDRVLIEDDVFIGARSIVLKGVRIGARSVIGAGSVVRDDIPPDSIAAGNPCVVIRRL